MYLIILLQFICIPISLKQININWKLLWIRYSTQFLFFLLFKWRKCFFLPLHYWNWSVFQFKANMLKHMVKQNIVLVVLYRNCQWTLFLTGYNHSIFIRFHSYFNFFENWIKIVNFTILLFEFIKSVYFYYFINCPSKTVNWFYFKLHFLFILISKFDYFLSRKPLK